MAERLGQFAEDKGSPCISLLSSFMASITLITAVIFALRFLSIVTLLMM